MRLEGKVAVITGAGGGLGKAMAQAFADQGAAVVCQDLNVDAARAVADSLPRGLAWGCDITDEAAVEEMFASVAADYGRVDVLVNNAGVNSTPGDGTGERRGVEQFTEMTVSAWERMLQIHLTGAFIPTRVVARDALAAGAGCSIICLSSVAATAGLGPIHYAAAKAGLLGLVHSLAFWAGSTGIRINAIAPGMISTPLTDRAPQVQQFMKSRTPMDRLGAPADIAPLAVYLASDESSFVTGQIISPNGGVVIG